MNDAIPWYQSPVMRAAIASVVSQLLAAFNVADLIPVDNVALFVDSGLQVFAILAAGWAAFKRARSNVQPVTLTGAAAVRKNAGGFIRASMLGVLLAISAIAVTTVPLAGCQLFGVQRPSNFDERVVAGYKIVETAADLVASVHAAGKISQGEANDALDKLQQLSDGIGVAVDLKNAGDFSNADTRLNATIAALELLQAQLRAR